MRAWSLLNPRNPVWQWLGLGLSGMAVAGTGYFLLHSQGPLEPKGNRNRAGEEAKGRTGVYVEQLGQSRFLLAYDAILGGGEGDLNLQGVHGKLEEPETLWHMTSPEAHKAKGVWTLEGPMDLEAQDPRSGTAKGKGRIEKSEPGLMWDHGIWTGLSTLQWEDLDGQGRGRWTFPPGWRRELDGRFVVEHKPVHWEATADSALKTMDAESLWVTLGLANGHMDQVKAQLEGGQLQAPSADMDPKSILWTGPIQFQREDGWLGSAQSGLAPRPPQGSTLGQVDLKTFDATRLLPDGQERIQAEGARWTPAGIRLEGNVAWEQPRDGVLVTLRAPRVMMREAPGNDLPKDLPVNEARAEGLAVLSWGSRSLSSPRMDVRKLPRSWRIQAPVLGRGEQGTFSAGAGWGTPAHWEFEGPVRANVTLNGTLRGDRLVWENATWTVTGRPATWNGRRERLAGPRLIRREDTLEFPDGLGGAISAPDGDVVLRADRGDSQTGTIRLQGRVDCQGQGWHLQAEQMTIQLEPDNQVRSIAAKGTVTLQGRIGEGRGEYLELDLINRVARWQGRVKGLAEVRP